jgi:hypothetical protein
LKELKNIFWLHIFRHTGGILFQMMHVVHNSMSIQFQCLFNFHLIFNFNFIQIYMTCLFYYINLSAVFMFTVVIHIIITSCSVVMFLQFMHLLWLLYSWHIMGVFDLQVVFILYIIHDYFNVLLGCFDPCRDFLNVNK